MLPPDVEPITGQPDGNSATFVLKVLVVFGASAVGAIIGRLFGWMIA